MNISVRHFLFAAARATILVLVLLGVGYYIYTRPQPQPPLTLYIADPSTACCYPEDDVNAKKLNWQDEQGNRNSWEEFTSLEAAKSAGYRLCR